MVLTKDFSTFMYDYTIHLRRKNVDCFSLQAFRAASTLNCHINEGFKVNAKKDRDVKKGEHVTFKNL